MPSTYSATFSPAKWWSGGKTWSNIDRTCNNNDKLWRINKIVLGKSRCNCCLCKCNSNLGRHHTMQEMVWKLWRWKQSNIKNMGEIHYRFDVTCEAEYIALSSSVLLGLKAAIRYRYRYELTNDRIWRQEKSYCKSQESRTAFEKRAYWHLPSLHTWSSMMVS